MVKEATLLKKTAATLEFECLTKRLLTPKLEISRKPLKSLNHLEFSRLRGRDVSPCLAVTTSYERPCCDSNSKRVICPNQDSVCSAIVGACALCYVSRVVYPR